MPTAEDLCKEAGACIAKKQYERAVDLLTEAILLDPDNFRAHETLAGVRFLRGEYDDAIEHYRRASLLDPKSATTLVNLGAVYNKKKQFQDAVKTLRSALARDRRCPEAYYNLGIAQRGLKQSAMSVSAYKEAIRLNPEMAEAYSNLGNVLLDMKNHSQAILNFRRALELRPGFSKAERGLQAAEEMRLQNKTSRNPFGRLVDVAELEKKNQTIQTKLVMTSQQRFDDRDAVHQLSREVQSSGEELLQAIKGDLEASILALSRLATEEREGRVWMQHQTQLAEATEKFATLLEQLAKLTDQLRSHEQSIKTECSQSR